MSQDKGCGEKIMQVRGLESARGQGEGLLFNILLREYLTEQAIVGNDAGGELRDNSVPEATKKKYFKEDVITELNALTGQLRKGLKTELAAWISLVTLMSVVLVR